MKLVLQRPTWSFTFGRFTKYKQLFYMKYYKVKKVCTINKLVILNKNAKFKQLMLVSINEINFNLGSIHFSSKNFLVIRLKFIYDGGNGH